MAGGISLGSAYFELDASAAPLIQALKQAEDGSKKSVAAISAATGIAEKDVQRLAQTYLRAETQRANASAAATLKIIKAHNDAADAAEKAAARTVQAGQKTGGGFADLLKGAVGLGAGFAGVALGIEGARKALEAITETTQAAAQAQFGLQAAFGASTQRMTEFSKSQGAAIGKTSTEIQQAIVLTATLGKNYGFTDAQIQTLIARTADYAALTGRDFVPAVQDVVSAMRGEGDAAERLGLALQRDALKNLADLTEEQKRNYTSLSVVEQGHIAFAEFLKQTSSALGTATKRTQEAAGASDNLKTATDNLALTLGTGLGPSVAKAENALAGWITKLDELIRKSREAAAAQRVVEGGLTHGIVDVQPLRPGAAPAEESGGAPEQARRAAEDTAASIAEAARKRKADAIVEHDTAIRRAKEQLEAAQKANDATAESAIKAIDKERKEKERWYDEERSRIEARRTYQLEDIDTRHKAAIKALADEREKQKDADDAAITAAEREKKLRLDVAEEAKKQALAAIDAQKLVNDRTREIQDREREDVRRAEDNFLTDRRRAEDQQRDKDQTNLLRDLEDEKKARLALIDDEIKAQEKRTQAAIRGIERQADKARAASEDAVRGIERQAKAEDERHRKAIQALDDEKDARLAILDAQLKTLDAEEKSEQNAEKTADLQKRVADAQTAATRARGTGTPAQIKAARGDLTAATQSGDEVAIANARERLKQLAGEGAEAIKKADEDLAKAQSDLRKEGVSEQRDAERQKLKDAKDAINDEIDARKRSEDDENRRRKASLDADKQAEQDKLKDTLDKLEKRKQARQDASKDELEGIRARREAVQKEAEDAIQSARDVFAEQTTILQDRRTAEDRDREDRRREQDRLRADERKAEDEALAVQQRAITKAYEDEQAAAEAAYNGPNGIITKLKQASQDHEREYSRQVAATNAAFEAERKSAERIYTNPEGNGLLDLLAKARTDEIAKLDASKADWQEWQKAASAAIKQASDDLDEFIKKGANIPRIGGDTPAQARSGGGSGSSGGSGGSSGGGSGTLTSSSTASTRSGRTGKEVKGDLVSWLNDAIDITGVSDDWITGLQQLVKLESGGDPQNENNTDVIDPRTGKNLGHAKGLLQTVQATFEAYLKIAKQRDPGAKNLADDVFDPVSNAVAAITYIQDTYGNINKIPGLYDGPPKFKGYASGGWITEPVLGRGTRTGDAYVIGERGPEYVSPASQIAGSASLLGSGPPLPDYAAMGAAMSAARSDGGTTTNTTSINVSGVGLREVAAEVIRLQKREQLLRGAS